MTVQPQNSISSIINIEEFLSTIPNTRYYGSKKRLLPWIYDVLNKYQFHTVLDGFGGTASVSLLFQAMGKDVRFNDALLSNMISAKVLLNGSFNQTIFKNAKVFFENITMDYNGKISRNYQGIFFTDIENAWLDGAMQAIHNINSSSIKNLYLYLVFQASLMKRPFNLFHRANLNLRTNKDIKRNFGNLSTWERDFPSTILKLLEDLLKLQKMGKKASIRSPLSVEKLSSGYDLVYLDPPYVQSKKRYLLEKISFFRRTCKLSNFRTTN